MKISLKTSRFLVLSACLCVVVAGLAATDNGPQQIYSVFEKAYYLSAEDGIWIRPGLKVQLQNVAIPQDRRPVVTFKLTDDLGQALDREGKVTPGVVSTSWILAYIPGNSAQYFAYTTRLTAASPITGRTERQASADSGGAYTSLGDGVYQYRFGTTLPQNYDQAATHTVGVYSTRDLREFGLTRHVANEVKSWVPNGAAVTKIRDVVGTAACNQCHDPLALHGGSRQTMEICILCHTTQSIDPDSGNTVDMPVMTHKIHFSRNLPSVKAGKPYVIYGNQMSLHDYSHVTYPQDMRNCQQCHKDTKQVDAWLRNPTRAYCGESCHDNINWVTGEGHVAGPQPSDRLCANCHYPEGEREYDAGIKTAHIPLYNSSQLPGPKMEIAGITNTAPGQSPIVRFKLTNRAGAVIAPSSLTGTSRIRFTLAGPTTDYRWYIQETADKAVVGSDGFATYTFTAKIPTEAKGTYAVESEGRVATTLNAGTAKQTTFNDPWDNVVKYFAVTGTTATPRRSIVDMDKCNKCHDKLMFHGNSRNHVDACVICHNPTLTARSGAAADNRPNESVSMQVMIHKIHTGEELETPYLIGNTSFNEVLYPGDRRDCLQCHKPGTYTVPLAATNSEVAVPSGLFTPMKPTSAACLSCHDSVEAAAHAFVNTAAMGESCAVCHKESASAGVTKVHAR